MLGAIWPGTVFGNLVSRAQAAGRNPKVRLRRPHCGARTEGHWLGRWTTLVSRTVKQNHKETQLVALRMAYQKDQIISAEMWAQRDPCTALLGNVSDVAIVKTTREYLKM